MPEQGVILSPAAAGELGEMVRWWRRHRRDILRGRGVTRAPQTPARAADSAAPVRVTSTTTVSGFYPAKVVEYDALTDTYADLDDVYVDEVNGGTLAVQRYLARRSGEYSNGTLVYLTDLSAAAAGITVEEVDGSPSYTAITTLRVDQADGFVLTQPSAGVARLDFTGGGSLTVEDADSSPTYAGVTTLRFDQSDGFVLSSPSAGVVKVDFSSSGITVRERDGTPSNLVNNLDFDSADGLVLTDNFGGSMSVDLADAGVSQKGAVSTGAQFFAGDKGFNGFLKAGSDFLVQAQSFNTSGTQNNYAIPTGSLIEFIGGGDATITGFVAGATTGRAIWLTNGSAFNITLNHADSGSTSGNQFDCIGDVNVTLTPRQSALLVHTGVWYMVIKG